jgi:hypothetical protein
MIFKAEVEVHGEHPQVEEVEMDLEEDQLHPI